MKIDTLHLVNSLSPQGITSKDNDFELLDLGVLITPKGSMRSFSKKVRLIPWANIKACDIAEEKPAEPVVTLLASVPAEHPAAQALNEAPTPPADVIKFVKDERTGMIREEAQPHRSVETPPETPKSAFAKLRDAKAEPKPE